MSALENTTGSAIGIETGIETEIEIGSETGNVEQIEGTSPPARAHTKSPGSQLRTQLPSKLTVNPRAVNLELEELVAGTGAMEVAPGGTLAAEITAVEAEVVEVRVGVDLQGAEQDCLYVDLRLRLHRTEIRVGRVGIGGWFSAWGCSSAE